jgi:hypothetical protein
MKRGKVFVSYEVLANFLDLPEYTNVVRVQDGDDPYFFEIYFDHEDLKEVPEGGEIPTYSPTVHVERRRVEWGNPIEPRLGER